MTISTFMGLETARRGVMAAKASLDVTAHNIANANTEGYSRQRAVLSTTSAFTTPSLSALAFAGQMGTGVEAASIERIKLDFFDTRFQEENQKFARYETLYQNLQQVELLMNEPSENGIREVMDRFWTSLEDLANDPETPATRRVVIENGVALSNSFSQTYEELDGLKENINDEIILRVDEVNRIVEDIASLNKQISEIKNIGNNPNDLLDKRDVLLDDLSELINISTIYKGTEDELVVSVNGRPIVQGSYTNRLMVQENPDNADLVDIVWEENNIPQSSDENILTVFANSSAENQSHTVNVKQLARKNVLMGNISIPYEEKPLNYIGNSMNFTPGYFEINDKKIYIDPENDSLNDVIKYINDSGAGVKASLEDNQIILEASNSGLDNQIKLNSGDSNFLRNMGMVNYVEGTYEAIEKDEALNMGPGTFTLNGKLVSIDPADSMEDIADKINKEDNNVKAIIEETSSGNYRMILEGTDGEYNFKIQDDAVNPPPTVLDSLGIDYGNSIPAGGEVTMGYMISHEGVEDQYERGLSLDINSQFEIEDSLGNIATIDIDSSNDSLALIAQEINDQLGISGVDGEAVIKKDAEGLYRLEIRSISGDEIAIRSNSGTILENLGIDEGTYNQVGPESFNGQNAVFNFDGADTEWSSNRVEGLIPDINFTLRGEGLANLEIRKILSGGKLKGLLESRDEVVADYMRQLDTLAFNFMNELNSMHFTGFGSDGQSQRIFFENFQGDINGYPEVGAARSMRVDNEMALDVNRLAAAIADPDNTTVDGLPQSIGVGSGANALNMADLKFALTMNGGTATFNEFFNQTISGIGTQANEARRINDNQTLLIEKLKNVREQVSGVSLDEEMTNMVKFQQAYNASAKVLSTMDQMLDVIINLAR